jgi:hypothetical protein
MNRQKEALLVGQKEALLVGQKGKYKYFRKVAIFQ